MGKFEEGYKQLNLQQKKAVDQIEGPVMVIAGPGTGKTQLLSMRVANIIRNTDTDPSSILCLTFTNKAAINMRQRIIELTNGEARAVTVKTFHSFAVEIMDIYPEYFWNGAQLITAPDASQIEIITNILKNLPLDNPLTLKFSGKFTSDRKVKDALKLVKEAGLTPDQLKNIIEANIAYIDIIEDQLCTILDKPLSNKSLTNLEDEINQIPNQGIANTILPLHDLGETIKEKFAFAISLDLETNKTFHTGELKKKFRTKINGKSQMLTERKANNWWLNLSEVYQQYRETLHAKGYFDHSDMIIEVITALQKHDDLRAMAQEKYLYVMIDEFQDTNAAQLMLAHYIADHPNSNKNPNLMVVGDDDQTIYKFNGADLNNMLSFEKSYTKTKKFVLTDNYRSTQKIIDVSEKIILNAEDRLVNRDKTIIKNLKSNKKDNMSDIRSLLFDTQAEQMFYIAEEIKHIKSKSTNNIAILARNHQSLKLITQYLNKLSIPINYELNNNIFEQEIIILIYKISGLINSIKQGSIKQTNNYLSEILRYPVWDIPAKTLWHIAIANYHNPNWLDYIEKSDNKELNKIANYFIWLAKESEVQPLPVIIEYIIGLRKTDEYCSPIRNYYIHEKSNSNYLKAISAINIIYGLTKEYTKLNNLNINDFNNYIKLSIENNLSISDESIFNNGENPVQLLTIHKAKGLEFDRVYIIDAIENNWRPRANKGYTPVNLPLQPVFDDQDDYARLMYVASTRAKKDLIVSSYKHDTNNKELLTSPLIYQVAEQQYINLGESADQLEIREDLISWPDLNTNDLKIILAPKLENFGISVSGLLAFLDLSNGGPKAFMENYLLNLPQAQTESEAFGSAIHKALEFAQHQVNNSKLDISAVIAKFNKNLVDQFLPINEFTRYRKKGEELINKIFEFDNFILPIGSKPEFNLSNININSVVLKGKLDRVDEDQNTITIVDYKTGKPLKSFYTKDKSKQIKVWRHRTQLIFYTLLLKNKPGLKSNKQIKGQMYYLEAESEKNLILEYIPNEEDIIRLSKLTEIIWRKITNLDFPDTSKYLDTYDDILRFEEDLLNNNI